ncbi:MAG: hypothetical protein ACFE94_12585 [Candidatus Hodarchaeota archaeon]
MAANIAKERIAEAELVSAEVITHICTGCYSTLSNYATQSNIKSYYITDLAQLVTGERPSLNILDNMKKIQKQVVQTISKNPNLIKERYIIKDGKILLL